MARRFCCPVCFSHDVNAFVRLPHCGHAFCKPCICRWMEQQPTCPLCRASILAGERMQVEMHGCAGAERDSMAREQVVATLRMLLSDHEAYTRRVGTASLRTLLPIFLFVRHQGGPIFENAGFCASYGSKLREALQRFPELRRFRLREPP